jgi:hypothetical protein
MDLLCALTKGVLYHAMRIENEPTARSASSGRYVSCVTLIYRVIYRPSCDQGYILSTYTLYISGNAGSARRRETFIPERVSPRA